MTKISNRTAEHRGRVSGLIHKPKLDWDQVDEIRRTYVYGSTTHGTKALALKFRVSSNTIHKIVRGKTWKTSPGDQHIAPPRLCNITPQKILQALVEAENNISRLRSKLGSFS
jgi:uncharacterized protein YjcR